MGPLWDFDWGFGFSGGGHTYFNNPTSRSFIPGNNSEAQIGFRFFRRFLMDATFRARYKARWNANYANIITIGDFIDEYAALLDKSQQLNYKRWPATQYNNYTVNYPAEIQALKNYLSIRIAYLNTEINKY